MPFIDTHSHIYGEEFAADLDAVVQRAKNAGAEKLFLPNQNAVTLDQLFSYFGEEMQEIKLN